MIIYLDEKWPPRLPVLTFVKKENPTSITLGSQLLLHKDLAKVFKDRLLEYISQEQYFALFLISAVWSRNSKQDIAALDEFLLLKVGLHQIKQ